MTTTADCIKRRDRRQQQARRGLVKTQPNAVRAQGRLLLDLVDARVRDLAWQARRRAARHVVLGDATIRRLVEDLLLWWSDLLEVDDHAQDAA